MSLQPAQEERLSVRAFGPVTEADLAIRDLTVFIGPQATGKSLTAQLLYFMRGIEDLAPGADEYEAESHLLGLLLSWMDPDLLELAISEDSSVSWRPRGNEGAAESSFKAYRYKHDAPHPILRWDLDLESNDALEDRLHKILDSPPLKPLTGEQQIYVPAGRIFCSLLPPGLAVSLLNRKRLRWPGFLAQFYATMEEAIEKLPESSHLPSKAAEGALAKSASSLRGTLSRLRNHVQLTFETRDSTKITTRITGGLASGQLESWPLWTLIQAHLDTPEVKRIFIEEPEAHLHPAAQRDLVEALVVLLRHRFRFVVTTHSPYILYALNNALMAGKVCAANRPLPAGLSDEFVLTPAQISAYRFASDGVVRPILDEETALLDAKDLDDPAGELGGDFARLQDALDAPEVP